MLAIFMHKFKININLEFKIIKLSNCNRSCSHRNFYEGERLQLDIRMIRDRH